MRRSYYGGGDNYGRVCSMGVIRAPHPNVEIRLGDMVWGLPWRNKNSFGYGLQPRIRLNHTKEPFDARPGQLSDSSSYGTSVLLQAKYVNRMKETQKPQNVQPTPISCIQNEDMASVS